MPLVFVYGTLLRGERNHRALDGASFMYSTHTSAGRTLVDLGPYPALLPADAMRDAGRAPIPGEVFRVDDDHLARLDAFEGRQYRREPIALRRGRAETYVLRVAVPAGARVIAAWPDRAPRVRS